MALQSLRPETYLKLSLLMLTTSLILFQFPLILWSILKIIGALIAICIIAWCLFQTMDILNAWNIKWERTRKDDKKDSFRNHEFEKHRESTYPSYPSGWYPLCWSHEVKKGEVIQQNALGKYYAIFRGDKNGEVAVLDAFCPHLGSNLTVGGKVCNDELICPFHRWSFDQKGQCKHIPYTDKIPKNARAKCYHSIEYHNMICVYYDANNSDNNNAYAQSIPLYNLPIQPELNSNEYSYVGSLDYGLINMHIQEFAENAADWMHFDPIHGKMMFPFTQTQVPFIDRWLTIHHSPSTHIGGGGENNKDTVAIRENAYGPNNKYFLYFITKSHLLWKGKSIPNTNGTAAITFCGPAGVCIFKFCIPAYDPTAYIILFHTHLPVDRMNLRTRFHWYASNKLPRLLVWYVVGNWISQWTNDIAIWENKVLLKKPCLVKGDGPIFKVRRWWRQFYPTENEKDKMKKMVIGQNDDETKENVKDNVVINDKQSSVNCDW